SSHLAPRTSHPAPCSPPVKAAAVLYAPPILVRLSSTSFPQRVCVPAAVRARVESRAGVLIVIVSARQERAVSAHENYPSSGLVSIPVLRSPAASHSRTISDSTVVR
ncbi:hypothetical protein FA10DRAFT_303657, partial [Acaromyces ingoldii]